MLDITWIRENPAELDAALKRRGMAPVADKILKIDEKRRSLQTEEQNLLAERNRLSKQVGELKAQKLDAEELMAKVRGLGPRMEELKQLEDAAAQELKDVMAALPNVPAADVPFGEDETGNVEVKRWGTPKEFTFKVKAHDDLVADLGLLDWETAAKIAGSRFGWLQGSLAKLDRAIAQFFLDVLTTEKGFVEVRVPYLVNDASVYGVGQLPKFEEDLFKTTDGRWLISTSEVPLTNYAQERIFKPEELPLKMTSWSPCFRSEAGSAGRDTKGLIRMHQFDKVEMVVLAKPEESEAMQEMMVATSSEILTRLGLPHRIVLLCTGDMGAASRKTFDLEVWVPSQGVYREISSISNCGDYQARRMNGRYKPKADEPTRFIHTLNGSALAVGRTMVAILENYQQEDGTVEIPEALLPYMGGLKKLTPFR